MSRVVSVSLSNFTPLEVAFSTEKEMDQGRQVYYHYIRIALLLSPRYQSLISCLN